MGDAFPSTLFFGMKDEDQNSMKQQQQQKQFSSVPTSSTTPTGAAPQKKRRNLPGAPYPDAEIIALSPKTLVATNRFICEVCNKGFQREQNLQLHRRGHNLPWKLKQKNPNTVVRRKVYLCPEPSCVHHDPSRALGDLTGIKKHYFRKHGEKKYKCDKCSKKYAVQSDWKAHKKTCGTREYRCDCGTIFSRRDSFITHRAFCDALTQESTRLPSSLITIGDHLFGNGTNPHNNASFNLSHQVINNRSMPMIHDQNHPLTLGGAKYDHLLPSSNPSLFSLSNNMNQDAAFNSLGFNPTNLLNLGFNPTNMSPSLSGFSIQEQLFNNNNNLSDCIGHGHGQGADSMFSNNSMAEMGIGGSWHSPLFGNPMVLPHMSATALLQKAAQIGSATGGISVLKGLEPTENQMEGLMSSLVSGNNNIGNGSIDESKMTLDFLGVGGGGGRNRGGAGLEMGNFGAKGTTNSHANHVFGDQELL